MPLNDRQIKNTKPAVKVCKLSDGGGLALLIHPNGGKYWQLNFRFNGKQKTLSIGTYPAISLSEARAARETAKQQLANGIDPAAFKQQEKANKAAKLINTFQNLAAQWHQAKLNKWKPNHAARIWHTLKNDVLPSIGQMPIDEIAVKDIKAILDTITARGASSTAEKVREWIAAIFRYAAVLELTDRNPAAVLIGHITPAETQHMPALPREQLTAFYRALNSSNTKRQNKIAVLLLMLVFVRSNELSGYIELGRVLVNDVKAKTSKYIMVGDVLDLTLNSLPFKLTVLALNHQRRPAPEARLLYCEDEQTAAQRESQKVIDQAGRISAAYPDGRPTKRDRRQLDRVKRGDW